MAATKLSATRPSADQQHIDLPTALGTWLVAWLGGNLVGSALIEAAGHGDTDVADRPVWVVVVAAVALWVPMVTAIWVVGRRAGVASPLVANGLSLRTVDLVGIPIGVLSQLVLLRLLYWPLDQWWPDTFGRAQVEENARDLYDTASGGWVVALVLVIVVGAPVVEELVYRGLVQGALGRRIDDRVAVVVAAAFFAVVHFRPVEYPGLFLFGLVLGICAWRTGRLGTGIVAHAAFNATGLLLVATR